jgi:hypothetical protein
MKVGVLAQRVIKMSHLLKSAISDPKPVSLPKLTLVLGAGIAISHRIVFPDRVPVAGHSPEFGFVLLGLTLSLRLVPRKSADELSSLNRRLEQPRQSQCIPNFFIVGAAKCGTTSLFDAISQHPDVFCCPVKEPNNFAFDPTEREAALVEARTRGDVIDAEISRFLAMPSVAIAASYEVYLSLFKAWNGERAIGEASTSYLPSSVAAEAISGLRPDARIIMILRDPVRRTYSHYLMELQAGAAHASFDKVVREGLLLIRNGFASGGGIVSSSFYAPQIQRFLDHFPREQVLILLFEDLVSEPVATLRRVFCHLGVDPEPAGHIRVRRENKSRLPRFARLNRGLFRSGKRSALLRFVPRSARPWLRSIYYHRREPPPLSQWQEAALRCARYFVTM